jgi:hypothetical protein
VEVGVSIGETLAQARRQAGLTVAQVSHLTRIRETIISGIESDDYAACGGDFYARGHIRAIAQVVGADSEPLIWEYDSARPEPPTIPPAAIPPAAIPPAAIPPAAIPPAAIPPAAIPPAAYFLPDTPVLRSRRRRLSWAMGLGAAFLAAAGLIGYQAIASSRHAPSTGPAAVGPTGNSGPSAPGTGDPYAHKVVVHVSATAACRVDFTTPAGLFLLQATLPAGTSKRWTFYRAVKMTLGNPGGIKLTVDGKNPLPPGLGAQPVTLSLGLNRAVTVSSPTRATRPPRPLRPVSATAFGPTGDGQGDNPQLAPLAIDGSPATAWHTDWYATALFGGLKQGTGLLLDMGRTVTITSAQITLDSAGGADFQLRVGSEPSLANLPRVALAANAAGLVRLRLSKPARGRYVVVWFTRLPPDSTGTFKAGIGAIRLNGRP